MTLCLVHIAHTHTMGTGSAVQMQKMQHSTQRWNHLKANL